MKRLALPGALLVALFPAACGDAGDGPLAPDVPAFSSSGATLVECPVAETRSTTGVVGLLERVTDRVTEVQDNASPLFARILGNPSSSSLSAIANSFVR